MNTKHRILLFSGLFLLLTSLSACQTQTPAPNNSEPEDAQVFSISAARFDAAAQEEAFGVHIEYPVLHMAGQPAMEASINESIYDLALSYYSEDELENISLDVSYECEIVANHLLTIALHSDYFHRDTMHPTRSVDTLLYDLNNGELLTIDSILASPAELPALILDGTFHAGEPWTGESAQDMDPLSAFLASQEVGEQFYLTPSGIEIFITIPHALGDWSRFSADFSEIREQLTPSFQALLDS